MSLLDNAMASVGLFAGNTDSQGLVGPTHRVKMSVPGEDGSGSPRSTAGSTAALVDNRPVEGAAAAPGASPPRSGPRPSSTRSPADATDHALATPPGLPGVTHAMSSDASSDDDGDAARVVGQAQRMLHTSVAPSELRHVMSSSSSFDVLSPGTAKRTAPTPGRTPATTPTTPMGVRRLRRSSLANPTPEGSSVTADLVRKEVSTERRKSLAMTTPGESIASTIAEFDRLALAKGIHHLVRVDDEEDKVQPAEYAKLTDAAQIAEVAEWIGKQSGFNVLTPEECKRMAGALTMITAPCGHHFLNEGVRVLPSGAEPNPDDHHEPDYGDMYFVYKGACVVTRKYTDDELVVNSRRNQSRDLGSFLMTNSSSLRNLSLAQKSKSGHSLSTERYMVPVTHKYLATLHHGKFFGERSHPGRVRNANVVADGPCTVFALSRANQDIFFNISVTEQLDSLNALRLACTAPAGRRRREHLERLEALVKDIPFFRPLSRKELLALCQVMEYESYDADTVVFNTGDHADTLYVTISGRVQLSVLNLSELNTRQRRSLRSTRLTLGRAARVVTKGTDTVLDVLSQGDAFGEMALVGEEKRGYTAKTLMFTELMAIDKATYDRVMVRPDSMHLTHKVAFLKSLPLFERLKVSKLASIASIVEEKLFATGALVKAQGAHWNGMYLLASGSVSVIRLFRTDGVDTTDDSIEAVGGLPDVGDHLQHTGTTQVEVATIGPGGTFGWYNGHAAQRTLATYAAANQATDAPADVEEHGEVVDVADELLGPEHAVSSGQPKARHPSTSHALGSTSEYHLVAKTPCRALFLRRSAVDRRLPASVRGMHGVMELRKSAFRRERLAEILEAQAARRAVIERAQERKGGGHPARFLAAERRAPPPSKAAADAGGHAADDTDDSEPEAAAGEEAGAGPSAAASTAKASAVSRFRQAVAAGRSGVMRRALPPSPLHRPGSHHEAGSRSRALRQIFLSMQAHREQVEARGSDAAAAEAAAAAAASVATSGLLGRSTAHAAVPRQRRPRKAAQATVVLPDRAPVLSRAALGTAPPQKQGGTRRASHSVDKRGEANAATAAASTVRPTSAPYFRRLDAGVAAAREGQPPSVQASVPRIARKIGSYASSGQSWTAATLQRPRTAGGARSGRYAPRGGTSPVARHDRTLSTASAPASLSRRRARGGSSAGWLHKDSFIDSDSEEDAPPGFDVLPTAAVPQVALDAVAPESRTTTSWAPHPKGPSSARHGGAVTALRSKHYGRRLPPRRHLALPAANGLVRR